MDATSNISNTVGYDPVATVVILAFASWVYWTILCIGVWNAAVWIKRRVWGRWQHRQRRRGDGNTQAVRLSPFVARRKGGKP